MRKHRSLHRHSRDQRSRSPDSVALPLPRRPLLLRVTPSTPVSLQTETPQDFPPRPLTPKRNTSNFDFPGVPPQGARISNVPTRSIGNRSDSRPFLVLEKRDPATTANVGLDRKSGRPGGGARRCFRQPARPTKLRPSAGGEGLDGEEGGTATRQPRGGAASGKRGLTAKPAAV